MIIKNAPKNFTMPMITANACIKTSTGSIYSKNNSDIVFLFLFLFIAA